MKDKNVFTKMYKFFEPKEVIFKYLVLVLKNIQWIKNDNIQKGSINLMKIRTKTIMSKVNEFSLSEGIQLQMESKEIGKQIISFRIDSLNKRCIMEMALKVEFNDDINKKQRKRNSSLIKNGFISNAKDIDNLIRDHLTVDGLNSYF